jgi:hypothetical protein
VRIFSLLFSYAILDVKSTSDVVADVTIQGTIGAVLSLDPVAVCQRRKWLLHRMLPTPHVSSIWR